MRSARSSNRKHSGTVRIGTAGWSLASRYKPDFPDSGSHLERYAAVFDAAEINTSFYRPHKPSTYEKWTAATPEGFRFAVKAPKAITHAKDVDTSQDLARFMQEIAGLGSKLGPILIQLPPNRKFLEADATRLLSGFRHAHAGGLVLEPRHPTWFEDDAEELLVSLRIARVAADPPRAVGADAPGGWQKLVYFRLHGSPEIYRTSYGAERLRPIAASLHSASRTGADVWCMFDNTASSAATADALRLKLMMAQPQPS